MFATIRFLEQHVKVLASSAGRATDQNELEHDMKDRPTLKNLAGTVLLLEDEAIIAVDMEERLRDLGASKVITMDTCAAALEWLAANHPVLAVVDPRGKDGFCGPVARLLLEQGVPFIVYSGDIRGSEMEDESFEKGVWLSKPASPDDLERAIAEA